MLPVNYAMKILNLQLNKNFVLHVLVQQHLSSQMKIENVI